MGISYCRFQISDLTTLPVGKHREIPRSEPDWRIARNDNMHQLVQVWFEWVLIGGYLGIIVLMAMGSTPLPVPAEVVVPPAAFLAAQGRLSLVGVILASTLGAYLGAAFARRPAFDLHPGRHCPDEFRGV